VVIKTLTLTQPWATLVMLGEKRVETRTIQFKHRGPVAIHAARYEKDESWRWKEGHPFLVALARHGVQPMHLLFGRVLGTVEFADGCNFTEDPFPKCLPSSWWPHLAEFEQQFGDYRHKRGGMLLQNARWLADPPVVSGMNGLWNWEPAGDLVYRPLEENDVVA
jgi:hypothetical protein